VEALRQAGLLEKLHHLKPRLATKPEILLCHTDAYVRLVAREVAAGAGALSTGDTGICTKSLEVALNAAGGVLQALDAVINGSVVNAFCLVRPPGHRATAERGMGFCIFNNVALAARYAQKKYNIRKVLIVDWDLHHGNGTQEIFYDDDTVFCFSTHQYPLYSGTGAAEETGRGQGLGFNLNCPVPPGAGRKEILEAFEEKLVPAMRSFQPNLVLVSAGFDARLGDPLGKLALTDQDFADLTGIVLAIAHKYAHDRLVSVLEGGYELEGLGQAVAAHIRKLSSQPV
jgi:acetoin utilization deacetylase AcuC-like enzyme